jgi:hypothetical protein
VLIDVLIKINDIAAIVGNELRNFRNDALTVWAVKQ